MSKKLLLVLPIFLLIFISVKAQTWSTVGKKSITDSSSFSLAMVMDNNGIPYIAYSNESSGKITVSKFIDNKWIDLGNAGYTDAFISPGALAIDGSGNLYIGYIENADSMRLMIKKYNGSDWVTIGPSLIRSSQYFIKILIDMNEVPHIMFMPEGDAVIPAVLKYNGSEWISLGEKYSGNSVYISNIGEFPGFALDTNNNPYIAFSDYKNSNKTTVITFDGTEWVPVGAEGFSPNFAFFPSLTIDAGGTQYIAFVDGAKLFKASVMKFNGISWEYVGAAGFSESVTKWTEIAIDGNGTLYVGFADRLYGYKATVMKFDGANWTVLGSAGFSDGEIDFLNIALDKNGIPYVSFIDNTNFNKITVMKFAELKPPEIPNITAPINGGKNISINPTLSWNAAEGASDYSLQVSTSQDFGVLLYDKTEIKNTEFSLTDLSIFTKYYWRIKSVNEDGESPWSEIRFFTTINSFEINVNITGIGTVTKTPDLESYNFGTTITLTAVPEYGYFFSDWNGDTSGINNPLTFTVDTSKNITANFVIMKYILLASSNDFGKIEPADTVYVNHGSDQTFQFKPNSGCAFHKLVIDGDSVQIDSTNYTLKNVISNHVIFAEFFEVTIVKDNGHIPTEYLLTQNYPNPFNPNTTINYSLACESHISLVVYNVLGEVVQKLVSEIQAPGYYETNFNGNNLTSGIYILKINANSVDGNQKFNNTIKLVLTK